MVACSLIQVLGHPRCLAICCAASMTALYPSSIQASLSLVSWSALFARIIAAPPAT